MEKHLQSFDVCTVCALSEEVRAVLKAVQQQYVEPIEDRVSPRCRSSYCFTTIKNNKDELLTLPAECSSSLPLELQNGRLFPFAEENHLDFREYQDSLGFAAMRCCLRSGPSFWGVLCLALGVCRQFPWTPYNLGGAATWAAGLVAPGVV